MDNINAEIFTLTYGSMVRQLLTDLEDVTEVNNQLDKMGYNIGIRLIDEFLAKSKTGKCIDFRDTADKIAKVGFKMFLNTTAAVTNWSADGTECSLAQVTICFLMTASSKGIAHAARVDAQAQNITSTILEDNPLTDFVELPEAYPGLIYCNVLCGIIRGALEMVNINASCSFVKDVLRGDDVSEMRLKLLSQKSEVYPYTEDD